MSTDIDGWRQDRLMTMYDSAVDSTYRTLGRTDDGRVSEELLFSTSFFKWWWHQLLLRNPLLREVIYGEREKILSQVTILEGSLRKGTYM